MKKLIIISITGLLTTMAMTSHALAGVNRLEAEKEIVIVEALGGVT